MLTGSCLCGAVRFEVEEACGPFELCHCGRCRRATGSSHLAAVGVEVAKLRWLAGRDNIAEFAMTLVDSPPAYRRFFCRTCGAPAPQPDPTGRWMGIPAGLLEGELGRRPDRHIFVEHTPDWDARLDELPRFTADEIRAHRAQRRAARSSD